MNRERKGCHIHSELVRAFSLWYAPVPGCDKFKLVLPMFSCRYVDEIQKLSRPFKYATPFPRGLSRVDVAERLRRQTANEPLRSAPLRTTPHTARHTAHPTRGTCHESKANTGGLSAGDGFSRAGRQETCTDVRGEGAPTFCKRQDPRGRYHAPAEEGPRRRGVTPRARQTLRRRVFVRQATLLACDASSHIGKRKGATLMTGKGKEKSETLMTGFEPAHPEGIRLAV